MKFSVKEFWENKILEWQNGRYNLNSPKKKIFENIADYASNSLRYCLEITKILLKPHIKGKEIIEIDCCFKI